MIQWNPIDAASLGTDFRTHSLFFNDQWRLSNRLTLNLGVRWDKNAGKDSADQVVADDSAFSPRLAVTWDPDGRRRWTVNAGYGKYVAGLANGIADSGSNGGVPATYQYAYLGPAINADPTRRRLIPTDEALRTLWSWFYANGGTEPAADVRRHPRCEPADRRQPEVAEHARVHRRRDAAARRPRPGARRRDLPDAGPTSTTRSATRRPAP